jgi:hypothetical protein
MTTDELLADACPRIRDLGWAFYFAPETLARANEHGLDGFRFYFLGRGGVLGDVDASVISSAFGYFNPTLVRSTWDSARERLDPRTAGHLFVECAGEFGRAHFAGLDALPAFCAAADQVIAAADPVGLALYAGAVAEPFAEDPPARATQLLALLRELRGSAHLVAIRASGLDALTAHCIKRPQDLAMFGWADDDLVAVTEDQRAAWEAAEALTDAIVAPAYDVLDAGGRADLVAGLDQIEAALAP